MKSARGRLIAHFKRLKVQAENIWRIHMSRGHGRPQVWARGGTCKPNPLWKCCTVFLCISSYRKTLIRRIIYALFSQLVVGFWGKGAQTPTGALSLDPLGWFHPQTPNLPTPGKKSCGRPCQGWVGIYRLGACGVSRIFSGRQSHLLKL